MSIKMTRFKKLTAIFVACFAMVITPICAYAAPQQTTTAQKTVKVDEAAVKDAINKKDYNYIIKVFFDNYGDYMRQHCAESNFKYFNAAEYLKKYPDVAAVCNNDPKLAVEHYLLFGVYEGRECGAKEDLVKFVKKTPETVLSKEFAENVNTPDLYFKAVETKIQEANGLNVTVSSSSGGSGSSSEPEGLGGGDDIDDDATAILMLYYCGADLEAGTQDMSKQLIDAMLGIYKSRKVTVLATLGGSTKWASKYLDELLGEDNNNTTGIGWFKLDNAKVETAINTAVSTTGKSFNEICSILHNDTDEGYQAKTDLYNALYDILLTADTMTQIDSVSRTAKMADSSTLEKMLTYAASNSPYDAYALTFSGHGGGSTSTVAEISVTDIGEALKNSNFGTNSKQLDFLGFDACFMGGVEVANYLKDYYKYMYGSEITQKGDIDYYTICQTARDSSNYADIGRALAYAVFTSRYIQKTYVNDMQTSAIFKSSEAINAVKALDDWAGTMVSLIGDVNSEQAKKIFNALKKASITAYQIGGSGAKKRDYNYNYLDTQDYLEQLKAALNAQGITACDTSIDEAIKAVHTFITANCYNYSGYHIYNSSEGGFVEESKDFWNEYLHYNFCGGNIMFPSYAYTTSENSWNQSGDKVDDDWIQGLKKQYSESYSSKYQSTGLSNYCNLMSQYMNHYLTKTEFNRVRNLAKELTTGKASTSDGTNDANGKNNATYADLVNVEMTPDGKIIKVNVGKYENNVVAPDNSSGDAYLDILDTASAFNSYLTRTVICRDAGSAENTEPTAISMIIAEQPVEGNLQDGINNRLVIMTEGIVSEIKINYAVGTNASSQATADDPLDMVITSKYNDDSKKKAMVLALDQEYQRLLGEANTAKESKDKAENIRDAKATACNNANKAYDDAKAIFDKMKESDEGYQAKWKEVNDLYDKYVKAYDEYTEADADYNTKFDAFNEKEKACDDYYRDYEGYKDYNVYSGACEYKYTDESTEKTAEYSDILLLFKKNGDEYEYEKSVYLTDGDNPAYEEVSNVTAISFYHYYIGEGSNGEDELKYIEYDASRRSDSNPYSENYKYATDYSDYKGYGDTTKYYYSIDNTKAQTVKIKEAYLRNVDNDTSNNGYFITMDTINGAFIDLNEDNNQHNPLNGEKQKGLITLGEVGEAGYIPVEPDRISEDDGITAEATEADAEIKTEESSEIKKTETEEVTDAAEIESNNIEADEIEINEIESSDTSAAETISSEAQISAEPVIIEVQSIIEESKNEIIEEVSGEAA